MIQTLVKNWWLLALCGVLDAVISGVYFDHLGNGFHRMSTVAWMGNLTIAAGICAIAAGVWAAAKRKSWLLVLNGLALATLGLIFSGITGPKIGFSTVAALVILTALSIAVLEFLTGRTLRLERHSADSWFLRLAGLTSLGFAGVFLALALRWIKVEPGTQLDLLWLGCYFAFTAICMLGLGLRMNSLRGIAGVERAIG